MANANVKFFKGACTPSTTYVEGGIYFDSASREIRLGKNGGGYDAYSGGVKDAVLKNNILTISFVDGRADVVLNFSDVASAKDTMAVFKALDERLTAVEDKVGDESKGLVKGLADVKTAINTINGDGDGSITKAVTDAKTELIGTDKDAATANTIKGAKAAAKAADDKAAAAQTAADSKIKSVTGNTTVIATTTEHAVSVSLKTSNKGNVKFTQDTDGLSASVTIPAATVTGVAANDKFLSLTDKLVGADISIAYDADDKKIYLYGKDKTKANAVSSIDCKDFIKDGMLDGSALYKATAATGTVRINGKDYSLTGLTAGHSYIVLVWNTDAAKDAMAIDVTSLVDVYTAGEGLTLTDHKFAVDYTKVAKKSDLDTLALTWNDIPA